MLNLNLQYWQYWRFCIKIQGLTSSIYSASASKTPPKSGNPLLETHRTCREIQNRMTHKLKRCSNEWWKHLLELNGLKSCGKEGLVPAWNRLLGLGRNSLIFQIDIFWYLQPRPQHLCEGNPLTSYHGCSAKDTLFLLDGIH